MTVVSALVHVMCVMVTWQQVSSAVVTIGAYTQCLTDENDCVLDSMAEGQYPSCSDCSKFIKCSIATNTLFACPPGTIYDTNLGVCNYPSVSTCGTAVPRSRSASISTTPTTVPPTPNETPEETLPILSKCLTDASQCLTDNMGIGQYPSCSDCSTFIKCGGGTAGGILISCGTGLHYDINLGVCNFMGQAVCGTSSS